MTKPTFYPEWATSDTTLPAAGTGNKERPQEILRTVGFDKGQVATAQEFNWLFDNVYDWIVHLDTTNTTSKTFTLAGDVTGSATYNNEAGWSVTTTVVDNSHNHVSANISDATQLNTADTIIKRDSSGNFSAGVVSADLNGNSATTTKLKNIVNISIAGGATGSDTGFDGTSNITIPVTSLDATKLSGTVPTANLTGSYNINVATVTSISGNMGILTGVLAHGETIPLPPGFTEAQCKWFVSPASIGVQNDGTLDAITCSAMGTRVVTMSYTGGGSPIYGTANYMIIGTK